MIISRIVRVSRRRFAQVKTNGSAGGRGARIHNAAPAKSQDFVLQTHAVIAVDQAPLRIEGEMGNSVLGPVDGWERQRRVFERTRVFIGGGPKRLVIDEFVGVDEDPVRQCAPRGEVTGL